MPHRDSGGDAQRGHVAGKVLRIQDDGTVPKDNPFVGQAAGNPRSTRSVNRVPRLGVHPVTGTCGRGERARTGGES